jgi:tellurite resistance protein
MEMVFLSLGVVILCLLTVLWSIKGALYPAAIKEKFLNPVLGPMMAYLPISTLLAVALILPRFPEYVLFGYTLTTLSLLIQVIIAWRVVHLLSMGIYPTTR